MALNGSDLPREFLVEGQIGRHLFHVTPRSKVRVTSYLALLVLYSSLRSPACAARQRGNKIAPRSWPNIGLISIPTLTVATIGC